MKTQLNTVEAMKANTIIDSVFFSIHSVKALGSRTFSVMVGNIENTPEKVELAISLYPAEDWHFEFHNHKIDLRPVIS